MVVRIIISMAIIAFIGLSIGVVESDTMRGTDSLQYFIETQEIELIDNYYH